MDPSKAAFAAVAIFLGLLRLAQSEHVGTPAITLTPRPQATEATGNAVAIRCDPVPIDGEKDRRLDTPTQRAAPNDQKRHP